MLSNVSIEDRYQEAVNLYNNGCLYEAEQLLSTLLNENNSDYDVLNFLGIIKLNSGKFKLAKEYFEQVIQLNSYHKEAYYNLGLCCQNLKEYEKALEYYDKVVSVDFNHFDALNNCGAIYLDLRHYQKANSYFQICLSIKQDDPIVYNNLGNISLAEDKINEAIECYRKALSLDSNNPLFSFNLGTAYLKIGDENSAVQHFEQAISLNPHYDDALCNIASAYTKLQNFEKAEEYLIKVNNSSKAKAYLYNNRGLSKIQQGLLFEAMGNFEEALSFQPESPEVHYNRSHILLLNGNYEEGLREYEWRIKREDFPGKKLVKTLTADVELNGKVILIRDEQGLGDSIQFVRYIKFIKEQGAHTIFECDSRLIPLFSGTPGIDKLIPRESENSDINFDHDIHLLSLPQYFGTRYNSIPAEIPYLFPEKVYVDKWSRLIGQSSAIKAGIVWAGNPKHSNDKQRSCPLKNFLPLFDLDGIEYYILQKGAALEETKDILYPLNNTEAFNNSFLDAAAAIECLDLVITVDTSIAHLSGALGKETWLLIPFLPDWRWMMKNSDTPWYPTMKIFRQDKRGDWGNCFLEITRELKKKTKKNEHVNMNHTKRDYGHIEKYFETIEKHVYAEPVSELHSEITKLIVKKLVDEFSFSPDVKILDIGCGQGPALECFRDFGYSPIGITLGEEDVNICRQKGFKVFNMDQSFLDFQDSSFDVIWARHVLEHSVMPLFTLMEYSRILKEGGIAYIEVPAEGTCCQHEANPNHYSVLSQRMWRSLFDKAGYTIIEEFAIPITLQMGHDEYWGFILKSGKKENVSVKQNSKIYLGLSSGECFGWGVCSKYIKQELSKKMDVINIDEHPELLSPGKVPGTVFHALADLNFNPLFNIRGERNIGYTFFENELTENSKVNSRNYDLILAGSSWCKDKLLEKGINHSDILLQGIDPNLFYPGDGTEKSSNLFTIFSGGKFEFRKGQDLVLRAVKTIQQKYSDIVLVNAWYNFWPASIASMHNSKYINFTLQGSAWEDIMNHIYSLNGLDSSRIFTIPVVPNNKMREIYLKTDLGLFPNRCEGGTNLVMMEYMACGKPVIGSFNSGHKDVLNEQNSFLLKDLKEVKLCPQEILEADWSEPSLDEIIDKIEFAYHNRDLSNRIGKKAASDMMQFTWEKTAENLLSFLNKYN